MPCHTRMKSIFLRGLLWLYLLELGFMLVSPEPGYLDFDNLPDTNFSCAWRIVGGYYADVEAACQMFHVCTLGQNNETMDIRFLCLNGTVFDQSTRVCERIDEVDCEKSEQYYDNNRELYGNSAPLIIPGDAESGGPPSTTTTTSTTTTHRPKYYSPATPRQANTPHYYTTVKPKVGPTLQKLTLHHHQFPSDSPPDFRFNPKEINLKLNSDASLDIKPISYQQQRFNDDRSQHAIVTTHSYNKQDKPKKNIDINYDFDYPEDKVYQPNYQSTGAGAEEEYEDDYRHQEERSTIRILSTPPSNQGYHFQRADRPPVNPPLLYSSLSSPAPFAHNTGNKRHSDPKIKKSVSVSISDQNGKELAKLNNTPISAIFSDSYLDYTEEEVTLLPLFEDVPKVKPRRTKRSFDSKLLKQQSFNMTDREAAEVLRFLLKWYTDYEKTTKKATIPLNAETITEINEELSPKNIEEKTTTQNLRNATEDPEVLEAKASKTAVEFEKYLEEDYQDYLTNNGNQTSKEDHNVTSPIEYDYYYYYDDDDDDNNNKTNTNEYETEDMYVMEHKQSSLNESNEIPKKPQNEENISQENTEPKVNENDDTNAVEIPLYDYVDDNYEAKTYKEEIKPEKIDVNEYVDDNYESSKNEVPAEMKMTVSAVETSTKEYFEATQGKSTTKENNEVTTHSYKNQIANSENGKEELHPFEETTQIPISTTAGIIPRLTTPVVITKESTTDLNFMIKDIEQHTKSVATNIVMPSYNQSTPVIHTKIEEVPTEIPTTKSFEASAEDYVSQHTKVVENIPITPKPVEITHSTRSYGRGRGRSRFTPTTLSKNKGYEHIQVTSTSSKSRSRGRIDVIPSSTHLPIDITENLMQDLTIAPEIVTEIAGINVESHSAYDNISKVTENEESIAKEETPADFVVKPEENTSDRNKNSFRARGRNYFNTASSPTPKMEEIQVKDDVLVTTAPEVVEESSSEDYSPTEQFSQIENKSPLDIFIVNKENSSSTDKFDIKILSDISNSSNGTQNEMITTTLPTASSTNNHSRIPENQNGGSESEISQYSTTEKINKVSSRSRGKNSPLEINRNEARETTTEIKMPKEIIEINNHSTTPEETPVWKSEDEVPTPPKTLNFRSRNHFNTNDIPSISLNSTESTVFLSTEKTEVTNGSGTYEVNKGWNNEKELLHPPKIEKTNRSRGKSFKTRLMEMSSQKVPSYGNDEIVNVLSTGEHRNNSNLAIISTTNKNTPILTKGDEKVVESAIRDVEIITTADIDSVDITTTPSSASSISDTTLGDVSLTIGEKIAITTLKFDDTVGILNEATKPNEVVSSRGKEKKDFVTSITSSTIVALSKISSTTEEMLTTITTPKDEEIIPSTTSPEKSLMDVLGYSIFNKLSENEDASLRELGYFSIPRIPEATESAKSHNVRTKGRHRFNVAASEDSTTENVLNTITPISSTSEANDGLNENLSGSSDILTTLPYADDELTTEEILTTITTPKAPESTTIYPGFPYRRRGGHRFNIVPTTRIRKGDLSTKQPKENLDQFSSTLSHFKEATMIEEVPITVPTSTLTEVTSSHTRVRGRHRFSALPENTTSKLKDRRKDKLVTDPSLVRSANPTLPRNNFKSTTPLTRVIKVKMRKENLSTKYVFTCLDKTLNRFYSDPRDCRLFHYCSPGYTSNQLVDMKFVCDLGTYYDDVRLICTKEKPARCV